MTLHRETSDLGDRESVEVNVQIHGRTVELVGYQESATLADLIVALEEVRRTPGLRTATCHLCGECCGDLIPILGIDFEDLSARLSLGTDELIEKIFVLPTRPDQTERQESVAALMRDMNLDAATAALIYEYNNSDPVTFRRQENGICRLQHNLLCTIYGSHPTACRFYLCNMGDRLSILYENIIRQGIWHSYLKLGWITEESVPHNPFLGAQTPEDVLLRDFDVDLTSALESLFFYF